jgi:hypothetical protein
MAILMLATTLLLAIGFGSARRRVRRSFGEGGRRAGHQLGSPYVQQTPHHRARRVFV